MCVHLLTSIYFIFALVPQILRKNVPLLIQQKPQIMRELVKEKKYNKRFIDMVSFSRNPISWCSSVTAVPTSC